MKIELICKEIIKPSNPTPNRLRVLNMSFLDHFAPTAYVRTVFFYTTRHDSFLNRDPVQTGLDLKTSLSKTLTQYYPFAGRIDEKGYIDCNDKGVEVFETRVNCSLTDVLERPKIQTMSKLFPISSEEALDGSVTESLVLVQINAFVCGGVAIGTCFSHKIADAGSIAAFMKDWAFVTRNPSQKPNPRFNGDSFFPVLDHNFTITPKQLRPNAKCLIRRFVFDGSRINTLRNKAKRADSNLTCPTRFEVVSAILWKCIVTASRCSASIEPENVIVTVNLRPRMALPVSENHVGNFALQNIVETKDTQIEFHRLVLLLKDGTSRFCRRFSGKGSKYEISSEIYKMYGDLEELSHRNDTGTILFSSWCRFPFYEADFGFGGPVWASCLPNEIKNCAFLSDTRDGDGIEAWVSLEEQVMSLFEIDEELLEFCALNPSPLDIESGTS